LIASRDAAITNPTDGDTVQGTVDVKGTVTDLNPDHYYLKITRNSDGHVVYSHTYYGGSQNFTDMDIYNWNTTSQPDGNYTIDLEARDAAGNKDAGSVDMITVTVNNIPDNKDQCKNGGWETFSTLSFRNQGDCVSYVNHHDGNGADDQHAH
jgi:hypothetical protein